MKYLLLSWAIIVLAAAGELSPWEEKSAPPQIIGGQEAPLYKWPWQAQLRYYEEFSHYSTFVCGGSLINNQWVLTATHCVVDKNGTDREAFRFEVRLGARYVTRRISGELVFSVLMYKKYPNSGHKFMHDITLMKLDKEVPFTRQIAPVQLAKRGDELQDGEQVYITGWGNIQENYYEEEGDVFVPRCTPKTRFTIEMARYYNGSTYCGWAVEFVSEWQTVYFRPDALQQVVVPIVDKSKCLFSSNEEMEEYGDFVICLGDKEHSSCHGDSGGPMMKKVNGKWIQFGVLTLGDPKCRGQLGSTIYLKVNEHIDWIKKVAGIP